VDLHEVHAPLAPGTRLAKLQASLRATLDAADPTQADLFLSKLAVAAHSLHPA
jgi:hypothetical protein